MHDVVESPAVAKPAADVEANQQNQPAAPRASRAVQPRQPRRAQERWSCSLAPADLDALLGILENELIPRLVTGFAPAQHAPLAATRQSV